MNWISSVRSGDSLPRNVRSANDAPVRIADRVTLLASYSVDAISATFGVAVRRRMETARSRSVRIGPWYPSHARSLAASTAALGADAQPSICDKEAVEAARDL